MRFPHVEAANAIPVSKLAEQIPNTIDGLKLALYGGLEITSAMRQQIWSIYASNMKSLTDLDRLEKEAEWFHPHSRLLVLSDDSGSANDTKIRSNRSMSPVVGYGVFRFDTEEDENDGEDEVLYCYELQISASVKRRGLGRSIVELMEMFGTHYRMKKIMITCFKENAPALAFYMKLGFLHDPICPSQFDYEEDSDEEEEEVNYFILSKSPVQQATIADK